MAERGTVNDVSKQSQLPGNPLEVEQPTDFVIYKDIYTAHMVIYRDQWVFLNYLPLTDALNGWRQVITSR